MEKEKWSPLPVELQCKDMSNLIVEGSNCKYVKQDTCFRGESTPALCIKCLREKVHLYNEACKKACLDDGYELSKSVSKNKTRL